MGDEYVSVKRRERGRLRTCWVDSLRREKGRGVSDEREQSDAFSAGLLTAEREEKGRRREARWSVKVGSQTRLNPVRSTSREDEGESIWAVVEDDSLTIWLPPKGEAA